MLQQSTLKFLQALKKNNNKEWFDKNRQRYDSAKADIEQLTAALIAGIGSFDPTVLHLQPKECTFRINRDVRFSKNKLPYKTNMAMYISRTGKKGFSPGYYLHVEPGASFLAGGIWMPAAPELQKVRQEIDYNWDEFRRIVEGRTFKSTFGELDRSDNVVLSRPPRGYEASNPAIEYLRFKSLIASAPITDNTLCAKTLIRQLIQQFKRLHPLILFLNRAIDE